MTKQQAIVYVPTLTTRPTNKDIKMLYTEYKMKYKGCECCEPSPNA